MAAVKGRHRRHRRRWRPLAWLGWLLVLLALWLAAVAGWIVTAGQRDQAEGHARRDRMIEIDIRQQRADRTEREAGRGVGRRQQADAEQRAGADAACSGADDQVGAEVGQFQ